jgi:hypothetical protein
MAATTIPITTMIMIIHELESSFSLAAITSQENIE